MDYEKKYNDALKKAKSIYRDAKEAGCSHIDWLEHIFPELTESEDERIRKHIIEILGRLSPLNFDGNEKGQCIAYLNRQAEQKPLWDEKDESNLKAILDSTKSLPREWRDWLYDLPNRFNLSQIQEWSEEDEKAFSAVKEAIGGYHSSNYACELVDWLKSLRPQKLDASKLENFDPVEVLHRIKKEWPMAWEKVVPTQEWSEKDEKTLASIIDYLNRSDLVDYDEFIEFEEFLQSLPMRCPKKSGNWKPSEEQMEALESAVKLYKDTHYEMYHERIVSLYEHLKKLM